MARAISIRSVTLDADMRRAGFSDQDIAVARRIAQRMAKVQRASMRIHLEIAGRNIVIDTEENPTAPRMVAGQTVVVGPRH